MKNTYRIELNGERTDPVLTTFHYSSRPILPAKKIKIPIIHADQVPLRSFANDNWKYLWTYPNNLDHQPDKPALKST